MFLQTCFFVLYDSTNPVLDLDTTVSVIIGNCYNLFDFRFECLQQSLEQEKLQLPMHAL